MTSLRIRATGVLATLLCLTSSPLLAQSGPLELKTQGIFWAGGEMVPRDAAVPDGAQTMRNQLYVEYFIPEVLAEGAAPIVLTHSFLSGVIWRTTPDGREGWAEYIARQGYPVFVIDPPGVGRSGFVVDPINLAATGQAPDLAAAPLLQADSSSWGRWNLGPAFGEIGTQDQVSNSPEALEHFMGSLMPALRIDNATLDAAYIAALEKITDMSGPAVFVGWSTAGGLAQRLAIAKPDLVRAVVILEGYNGQMPLPTPENWFDYCPLNLMEPIVDTLATHDIPLLSLNGEAGHTVNTGHVAEVCSTLVAALGEKGATAENIWLPDVGLTGNSHMSFWDMNSDDIAQVMLDWLGTVLVR